MTSSATRRTLWGLLAFAFVVRLLTLRAYPLTDDTESRYAEMARKMLETGQWIVPQIDYGVPFWAKPPLSFWMTAASFKLMGVGEFAARVPSLLLCAGVCALAYVLGRRYRDGDYGLRASLVVATSLLMIVSAGSVMTDPAMIVGTTLSMLAFWLALTTASSKWGYVFFLGLAIGLMSKGPIAAVLTLAPIGIWAVATGRVRESWNGLPWVWGLLLTAVLVLPWYWAAEVRSPGFLHYFIVGEHWQRYTVSGWKGDLYGVGHAHPRGTIWLYALLGTLPWSPWVLWLLARRKARVEVRPLRAGDGWIPYLLCWMFAPVVFFTMSGNILPTYVLPGLAAFGLFVAHVWQAREQSATRGRVAWLGVVTPCVVLLLVWVVWPRTGFQSQKEIIAAYRQSASVGSPLIYFGRRQSSVDFYSRGKVKLIGDDSALRTYLGQPLPTYVAIEQTRFKQFPAQFRSQFSIIAVARNGRFMLLRHAPRPPEVNAAYPPLVSAPRGLRPQ